MINFKYDLDKSFQDVLYRIDNWVNKGSGWVIESIDAEYLNVSIYSALSGGTHIKLPSELKQSMKGLINIKKKWQKMFSLVSY